MSYGGDSGLKTIQDGNVPSCRMADASECQSFVRRLVQDDSKRSKKRALVAGLVDGNPPYNHRKLREAGRADACNVNWGTGRSYMESGSGAFYDLTTQAPGFVDVKTSHGNEEQRVEWSRIISEQADQMFSADDDWDQDMQLSNLEMTLNGRGPLYFENGMDVFPVAIEDGDVKVPERTPSKLSRLESAVVIRDLYPPELYKFIEDEQTAEKAGWDVEFTRLVIQGAMDVRQPDSTTTLDWGYFQQQLKSNSLNYIDETKICRIANVFWKEFDGRVTHAIVEREDTTSKGVKYLYLNVGRYESFKQALHPMFFDRGRGGWWHTVTGLGVKQYSGMEYENRLVSNLMDKSFAPKIFFKPGNAESKEKFQVARYGDWGLLPAGTDFIQNPIQGFLSDGLAMFRTSSELMRSNLSQYRQPVEMQKPGNPETAFKEKMDASLQGSLSGTTYNRYYRQLDSLYAEIIRRACNINSTDDRAKDFQKRCMDNGVPRECFGRIASVRAVRVIGGGNSFMRQQSVQAIMPIVARLPDEGQQHWLNDYIAANVGSNGVGRYNPSKSAKRLPSDQSFDATEGVVMAKNGISPPVTNSQRPTIFAVTYLKAAADALNSVSQGANPAQVLKFVQTLGPAIAAHMKRLQGDPLSEDLYGMLEQRMKKLASLADRLKKVVQQQAQKAKQQQAKTRGALTDEQLATQKLIGDEKRKNAKLKFQMQRDAAKTRHSLQTSALNTKAQIALQDARTASDISNAHRKTLAAFKE